MTWTITLAIGIILSATGAFLGVREHLWLRHAQTASGTVVEMIKSRGGRRTSYTPRVQYAANDGSQHEFVRSYGSSPPDFSVGQKVTVAYDPESYESRILTFGQRFGLAATLVIVGLGLILLATTRIVGNQFVPRIYLR
jgi:hypothetical protein